MVNATSEPHDPLIRRLVRAVHRAYVCGVGSVPRVAMVALCAVAMACGTDDDDVPATGTGDGAQSTASEATPFAIAVDAVPPGFHLENAGRGTSIQDWG